KIRPAVTATPQVRSAISGLFLIALWLQLTGGLACPAENPFKQAYPFDTAVLSYVSLGSQKGSSMVYVRGGLKCKLTNTSGQIMGMDTAVRELEITTPQYIYYIDLKEKKGTRWDNPSRILVEEYEKLTPEEKVQVTEYVKKHGHHLVALLGGGNPKTYDGILMGRPCLVIDSGNIKSWIWKGTDLALRTEGSVLGLKTVTAATKIDENIDIPSTRFVVPEDVDIQYDKTASQVSRQLAKTMLDNMKNPKAADPDPLATQDPLSCPDAPANSRGSYQDFPENKEQVEMMRKQLEKAKKWQFGISGPVTSPGMD
ncbi:MAG: hypothetical protein HQK60_07380, partial [Deltaproteobacteria bacterium]|nr:hypothetical protein [Deltaproteobacteria bacterium]